MGLRKDATYLQFRNAVPNTALAWNASGVPYHMGVFTPATALLDGAMGLVPKPLATQQNYILSNNGWIPNTGGSGGSGAYPDLTENTTIGGANTYGFHLENISNLSALVIDEGSTDKGELDIGNTWFEATVDSDFGFMSFDNSTGDSLTEFYGAHGTQFTLGGYTGLINLGKTSDTGYAGALIIDEANSLIQLQRTTVSAQVTKIEIGGSEIGTTNVGNILVTGIAGNFQGVRYAADYQAQYTDRSLVDKNFVLTQIALGGAAIINTAGVNEIPKSASAVSIVPSGIYSTSIGSISLGTALAGASRYVSAEGSASDVALQLYAKGNAVMGLNFGLGGLTVGDPAVGGGRVLTVGSSGGAAGFMFVSKGGDNHKFSSGFASAANIAVDPFNAKITLIRSSTTVAQTFDIVAGDAINATYIDGDSIRLKAGDAHTVTGNGSGGSVVIQAGNKRIGGSGVDGSITLAYNAGILFIGSSDFNGDRLVAINSLDTNPSLTIRQKGTGTLNLGLVTGLINLVGSGIRMNSTTGSAGQFLRYDMTWATPSTGTPFTNTAATSEIPKSASSTSIAPSGIFSYTHGDLDLGTDIGSNRNITATGSSTNIDLRLFPKGGSGKIILGTQDGAIILGNTGLTGNRTLLTGSSDANASLYIQTSGTGTIHIGYSTNSVNLVGSTLKMNGVAGAAGQFLRYDMTWQTPAGGLTNTAATNELMKSSSGNAVPSGIFSTTLGNLGLGSGLTGSSRSIYAEGSETDIYLLLYSKGAAAIELGFGSGGLNLGSPSLTGDRKLVAASASASASLTYTTKGGLEHRFNTSLDSPSIILDPYTAKITLARPPSTTNVTTLKIYGTDGIVSDPDGDPIHIIAGGGYPAGNGYGGNIRIAPGLASGTGADGYVELAVNSGFLYVGNLSLSGGRTIALGSNSANANLGIEQRGTGTLYLGLSTGVVDIKGTAFKYEGTVFNNTVNTEIPQSTGTRFIASGIFNPSHGSINLGSDAGTSRYVQATGSGSAISIRIIPKSTGHVYLGVEGGAVFLGDIGSTGTTRYIQPAGSETSIKMFIYPKGTEDIELAVPNGRTVWIGNASDAGSKYLKVGSSDTNADLVLEQKGSGWMTLGNSSGFMNFKGGAGAVFYIRGVSGGANQYFGYQGWAVPVDTLMMAMDVAAPKAAPMTMMVDAQVTNKVKGERVLDFLRGLIQEELTKRGLI